MEQGDSPLAEDIAVTLEKVRLKTLESDLAHLLSDNEVLGWMVIRDAIARAEQITVPAMDCHRVNRGRAAQHCILGMLVDIATGRGGT